MVNVAVTISLDLFISCIITIGTCLVCLPAYFCTSRGLCIVLNNGMIVLVNRDSLCSCSSTSGTCVSHNTCAYASSRSCYNAFALFVVARMAERLFAILSITNVVIIFVDVIKSIDFFLICVSFVVLTSVSHNAVLRACRSLCYNALVPVMSIFIDGNIFGLLMLVVVLTSVGHNTKLRACRSLCYNALVPVMSIFIDGNIFSLLMIVVVLTSVGHNAKLGTCRSLCCNTFIPIVTDSRNFFCISVCCIVFTSVSLYTITLAGRGSGYLRLIGVTERCNFISNVGFTTFAGVGCITGFCTSGSGYGFCVAANVFCIYAPRTVVP